MGNQDEKSKEPNKDGSATQVGGEDSSGFQATGFCFPE